MSTFGWLLLCCSLIGFGVSWHRSTKVRQSLQWLATRKTPQGFPLAVPKVYIVVPLLREQSNLALLLNRLAQLSYPPGALQIITVTTEKETYDRHVQVARCDGLIQDLIRRQSLEYLLENYMGLLPRTILARLWRQAEANNEPLYLSRLVNQHFRLLPSTADLCKRWLTLINRQLGTELFVHCHYPDTQGSMAAQVNYAVRHIASSEHLIAQETYIGIYTGDALAHPELLHEMAWVAYQERVSSGKFPLVFQQSAWFLRNQSSLPDTLKGDILRAAGVFQTAFALGRELPAHRQFISIAQRERCKSPILYRPYAPVIGHGLFIRLDLFQSHHGLPTDVWCEDIALTFLYHLRNIPIWPLRILEENETPYTLRSYWNQSRMWFTTAMQTRKLLRLVQEQYPCASWGLVASVWIRRTMMNAEWAFGPIAWLLVVLLGFLEYWWLGITSLMLFVGHILILQAPVLECSAFESSSRQLLRVRLHTRFLLASVIFFIVSPVGPLAAILTSLSRDPQRLLEKPKTER